MEEKLFRLSTLQNIVPYLTGDNEKTKYKSFKELRVYFMDLNLSFNDEIPSEKPSRHDYTLEFLIKHNDIQTLSTVLNDLLVENEGILGELTEIVNKDTQKNFRYVIKKESDGGYSLVKTNKKNIPKWTMTQNNNDEGIYYLSYQDNGELYLNNLLLLGMAKFNSTNYKVFKYIYENEGKTLLRADVEKEALKGMLGEANTFNHILNKLGIKGIIKDMFFPKAGKYEILFKNNLTVDELKEKNLYPVDMRKYMEPKNTNED